jgi:GH25 family lysozyme M1 (1,4-beta-N-acetylmuramidase)
MAPPGRKAPFRAGGETAAPRTLPHFTALTSPMVLLADVSEWEPDIADALYLAWSKAIVIRAAYGDQHDDRAWYGGARRDALHAGGVRFLGIYQYLVAGQDGAAQADALHRLVGPLQPGELLVADFEEGQHPMLTAWYNRMLALGYPHQYLWTYTGYNFGNDNGAADAEWVAAYGQAEPDSPHKLWQFTSSFKVPGVGAADCSIFHGSIGELAALAYQAPQAQPKPAYGPPTGITLRAGTGSVLVETCDAPVGMTPGYFEVSVFTGSYPSPETKLYERYMHAAPQQFGSLQDIPSGTHMTLRVVAVDAFGVRSRYADTHFEMP